MVLAGQMFTASFCVDKLTQQSNNKNCSKNTWESHWGLMLWVQKLQANWSNNYSCAVVSETSGEIGWVLTLAIVSILSAAVGAVVMVIILQCRK